MISTRTMPETGDAEGFGCAVSCFVLSPRTTRNAATANPRTPTPAAAGIHVRLPGSSVAARFAPGPPASVRSASTISRPVGNRCCGSFAIARVTTGSNFELVAIAPFVDSAGTFARKCCSIICGNVAAANGRLPLRSSNAITPSEYRSDAGPAPSELHCSGAM